jgi:hypothetical protein
MTSSVVVPGGIHLRGAELLEFDDVVLGDGPADGDEHIVDALIFEEVNDGDTSVICSPESFASPTASAPCWRTVRRSAPVFDAVRCRSPV